MSTTQKDAGLNLGFGGGFYGTGYYGTQRPSTGTYSEATSWSLDNFGEYLDSGSYDTGIEIIRVYNTPDFYVDNITVEKTPVTNNAPLIILDHVVTEERFIFFLVLEATLVKFSGVTLRIIQWAPQAQIKRGLELADKWADHAGCQNKRSDVNYNRYLSVQRVPIWAHRIFINLYRVGTCAELFLE